MPLLHLPCDCGEEEHEIWVEAEVSHYHSGHGIYSPEIGDELPCGRQITQADMTELFKRLSRWGEE